MPALPVAPPRCCSADAAMTMIDPDVARVARDPLWFAHRYDPGHDAVHFLRLPREAHRAATFITDEYLPANAAKLVLHRRGVMTAAPVAAPVHFVFHSAYCCSTLLVRAFDIEGVSMGLKEPPWFNDLVGWKQRGGTAREVAAVLDDGLTLLARPFGPGEAIVIKPSNVANAFAPAMLTMRPEARALLLHAPLTAYLGSIVRKGMWGRLWVRDLLIKQLGDGLHDFGFTPADYLGQTDLQVAAMGWLAQHALFERMARGFGTDRVRTLDSETLVAQPAAAMRALAALFGMRLSEAAVAAVITGPAFATHSKFGQAFGADARAVEQAGTEELHRDEIDKVATWTAAVAASAGVSMTPPVPLLRSQ